MRMNTLEAGLGQLKRTFIDVFPSCHFSVLSGLWSQPKRHQHKHTDVEPQRQQGSQGITERDKTMNHIPRRQPSTTQTIV